MSAPGAKRALLIGSPVHGLRGTENDLNTMTTILKSRGFETESAVYVNRLFHRDATRQKILDAWEALIRDASWGDTVVIYYSGHGVCVESDVANEASTQPSKIQFIVPYDFDCTLQQWKGISDGELSLLLRRITAKTRNVTYILDCCHSARLGRKYGEVHFEPKAFGLSKSLYTGLATILERLRQEGRFTEDRLDTNPYAVRISAAGTDETAWEYHKDGHSYMGLLTRSLSKAIMKSNDNRSWRDIMLEVAVLVEQDYPEGNQHPRSAGPDNRRPFSLDTTATGALLATIWDDEYTMLRGGRVHGIQKGDVFTITPFGSHNRSGGKATEGTVILVNAFAAVISPTPKPSEYGRGLQLHTERLINGVSLNGVLRRLLERAKEYVQAQNILSLRSGIYDEAFGDNVDIEVGIQNGGAKNVLTRRSQSLPGATIERAAFALKENDRLYISMKNTSTNKVFVNALSVDAAGKTTLVSKAWERGIGLTPGRSHTLALRTFPLLGIPIRWPTSVPRSGYVEESLVFVITNEEVDLRNLDASLKGYVRRGPDDAAARDSGIIQYHVEHVRYHLRPSSSS
ncbi:peptidase c14 caspase catalytic subunit p20 [Colletotrichum asianum]